MTSGGATILVMTALSAVIHPDGHAVAKVALKRAGHAMPHTTFVPDDLNYAGSPWLSIEPGLYSTGSDGTVELPIKNESKTVGMTLDRGDYVGEAQILNDDEIMHISHDLEDDVMAGLSEKDKTVIKMWQEEMKFCEWKAPGLEESVVRSFCKEQGGSSSLSGRCKLVISRLG